MYILLDYQEVTLSHPELIGITQPLLVTVSLYQIMLHNKTALHV